jgi:hypothetical protein
MPAVAPLAEINVFHSTANCSTGPGMIGSTTVVGTVKTERLRGDPLASPLASCYTVLVAGGLLAELAGSATPNFVLYDVGLLERDDRPGKVERFLRRGSFYAHRAAFTRVVCDPHSLMHARRREVMPTTAWS